MSGASHPKPRPRLSDTPYEIAREGGCIYWRRGDSVYTSRHGGTLHLYCAASLWHTSQAARRLRGDFDRGKTLRQALAENDQFAREAERIKERNEARSARRRNPGR